MSRSSQLGGSGITTCPPAPISLRPPLNSTSKLPPDNTFVEVIDVGVTSSKDTWRKRTCERGTDNMNGDELNESQLDDSNEDNLDGTT